MTTPKDSDTSRIICPLGISPAEHWRYGCTVHPSHPTLFNRIATWVTLAAVGAALLGVIATAARSMS